MYQHILLAIELGDENPEVEAQALAMQMITHAKLTVIHIIESLPSAYSIGEIGVGYEYIEDSETLMSNTRKGLQPIAKRLNIPESNIIVNVGHVSSEILHYAENNQVDLIVTGSHGRHGFKLLLGSTANAILHKAKCDVLAVRLKE